MESDQRIETNSWLDRFRKDSHLPAHDSRTGWLWQQCWEDTGPPEHQLSLCNRFWKDKKCKNTLSWMCFSQVVAHFITFGKIIKNVTVKAERKWRFLIMCCLRWQGYFYEKLKIIQCVWRFERDTVQVSYYTQLWEMTKWCWNIFKCGNKESAIENQTELWKIYLRATWIDLMPARSSLRK